VKLEDRILVCGTCGRTNYISIDFSRVALLTIRIIIEKKKRVVQRLCLPCWMSRFDKTTIEDVTQERF